MILAHSTWSCSEVVAIETNSLTYIGRVLYLFLRLFSNIHFHVRIQINKIGNELQLNIEYIRSNNHTYKYIKIKS